MSKRRCYQESVRKQSKNTAKQIETFGNKVNRILSSSRQQDNDIVECQQNLEKYDQSLQKHVNVQEYLAIVGVLAVIFIFIISYWAFKPNPIELPISYAQPSLIDPTLPQHTGIDFAVYKLHKDVLRHGTFNAWTIWITLLPWVGILIGLVLSPLAKHVPLIQRFLQGLHDDAHEQYGDIAAKLLVRIFNRRYEIIKLCNDIEEN